MIVEAKDVSKHYGKNCALDNVTLNITKGSAFALLGRNGAGKTTFVKSLLGLLPLKSGSLNLNGKDVSDHLSRQNVSYMPEKFSFFPYYTLGGLCEFYGKMKGLKGSKLSAQVDSSLTRLNLLEHKNKKVKECSKGQLQRAGLAATLMGNTDVFVLDEPFSGLDPIAIKELQDLLVELKSEGKTLIINSHDLDHVKRVCDHMAILDKGKCIVEGQIDKLIGEQDLLDYFYEKVQGKNA
jgi:ABC-type multidrug transport system ATPase subunit